MSFYRNLQADLYRFCRSPLLLLHLIVPILGFSLFLWYDSFCAWSTVDKLSGYIQILSIAFPVLLGIITSMLADSHQAAGGFYDLLATPSPKYLPHLSKLTLLILSGMFSSLLALLGFGIGFHILGFAPFDGAFYFATALLLLLSVLPLYLLHYLTAFLFGKGVSLSLGVAGSLLSALLLTGLGDGLWSFLPWGIAARFSQGLLLHQLIGIDFWAIDGMIQGVIMIVIFCFLFFAALLFCFSRWEGRKAED